MNCLVAFNLVVEKFTKIGPNSWTTNRSYKINEQTISFNSKRSLKIVHNFIRVIKFLEFCPNLFFSENVVIKNVKN